MGIAKNKIQRKKAYTVVNVGPLFERYSAILTHFTVKDIVADYKQASTVTLSTNFENTRLIMWSLFSMRKNIIYSVGENAYPTKVMSYIVYNL
jgi:hypothetical protein